MTTPTAPKIPAEVMKTLAALIADRMPRYVPGRLSEMTNYHLLFRDRLGEWLPGAQEQLVSIYAKEIFLALHLDGGVKSARHIINAIEDGDMTGSAYVGKYGCACFYGQMSICTNANADQWMTLMNPWDAEADDTSDEFDRVVESLEQVSYDYRDQVLKNLVVGQDANGDDIQIRTRHTPIESMLSGCDVEAGQTHETNPALEFMHTILTLYVAQNS